MNAKASVLIRYIFPALGGLFVTYLYNVVDGIFVGQGVGSRTGADRSYPSDAFSVQKGQSALPALQYQRHIAAQGLQARRAGGRHTAHHARYCALL